MAQRIQTAVAAAASPAADQLILHLLEHTGLTLCALTRDGFSAMEALERHRPDLLIADMLLPGMEGGTLTERAVCGFSLPVRPAAILLHFPHFSVPNRGILDQAGAVLLEKPVSLSRFAEVLDMLRARAPRFLPDECAHADHLLDALGVPDHIGRNCLRWAILICAADQRMLHRLGSALYPLVGEINALSADQAERAMRHAIDLAWQSDRFENQNLIFADTIDAGRGQPTCGQMISRLADILRLEG